MKSVLMSIKPYYVFLIIARTMGWKVEQEKTVEVRKNFPQAKDWDKKSLIYCSRDRRSFNRIPKEYQPLMAPLLGKVIGEFVCDEIKCYEAELHNSTLYESISEVYKVGDGEYEYHCVADNEEDEEKVAFFQQTCLTWKDFRKYLGQDFHIFYGWHISNLKIYNKPKELSEFTTPFCPYEVAKCKVGARLCKHYTFQDTLGGDCDFAHRVTRPPQSWCYAEEI